MLIHLTHSDVDFKLVSRATGPQHWGYHSLWTLESGIMIASSLCHLLAPWPGKADLCRRQCPLLVHKDNSHLQNHSGKSGYCVNSLVRDSICYDNTTLQCPPNKGLFFPVVILEPSSGWECGAW